MAAELAAYLRVVGADGKVSVNVAKLKLLAEANSVWDDKYENLNVGQQRLNIGNKLRALERTDQKIIWP